MVEIGRIEKPALDSFAGKRKLYIVRSLRAPDDSTDEFKRLVQKYWDDVLLQIGKLEAVGRIRKIFCEHILSADDLALKKIAGFNARAAELIRGKLSEGAILYPLEKEEIYGPLIDWRNCLEVVETREVFEILLRFYHELAEKRLKYLREVIEENLGKEESGLLLTAEEDKTRLLFSEDIELFFVTPPSYDDVLKRVREERKKQETEGI